MTDSFGSERHGFQFITITDHLELRGILHIKELTQSLSYSNDLGLLLEQGFEDLEQKDQRRRLENINLSQGDVRRPQDDRRAEEESERRLGDRDTSLVGLLVMPFSEG